jgi:hypothetical protein
MNKTHPQYYKVSDDLEKKMPEEEWSTEVVDGINKALKSAHQLSEASFGQSNNSEIVEVPINVGSPWRKIPDFVGSFVGSDAGTRTFSSSCQYMKHYDGSVEFQGSFAAVSPPAYPGSWFVPHTVLTLAPELRPAFLVSYPIFSIVNPSGLQLQTSYVIIDNALGSVRVFGSETLATTPAGGAPSSFGLNLRFMAADPRPVRHNGFPVAFKVSRSTPPIGVVPIACVEENQRSVRPQPMLTIPDWSFSVQNGKPVVTINNLGFSGFNCRLTVWFLVIYQ